MNVERVEMHEKIKSKILASYRFVVAYYNTLAHYDYDKGCNDRNFLSLISFDTNNVPKVAVS